MSDSSKINVKTNTLKGKEKSQRVMDLMGKLDESVGENKGSKVELTKEGPDGNVYAIVRESHRYYIKKGQKDQETGSITESDLHYIGGLQNKNEYAYPSYSKALKQLNFKFHNLNESYGINKRDRDNVFITDNILNESSSFQGSVASFGLEEQEDEEDDDLSDLYIMDSNEERGEWRLEVKNAETGEEIFSYNSSEEEGSPIEDGFMKDMNDTRGLEKHLIDLGVLPEGATIMTRKEAMEKYNKTFESEEGEDDGILFDSSNEMTEEEKEIDKILKGGKDMNEEEYEEGSEYEEGDGEVKTVADIGDDYELVTDPSEVSHILNVMGMGDSEQSFDGLFIKFEGGDIVDAYGFEGIVPNKEKSVEKIEVTGIAAESEEYVMDEDGEDPDGPAEYPNPEVEEAYDKEEGASSYNEYLSKIARKHFGIDPDESPEEFGSVLRDASDEEKQDFFAELDKWTGDEEKDYMNEEKKEDNPWAICNAMKNKHGWDEDKTESCIQDVKKKNESAETSMPKITEALKDVDKITEGAKVVKKKS